MIFLKVKLIQGPTFFFVLGIDGYIIPKNDEFFSEYSKQDRLKIISNFSGSAGYAVVLKKKKSVKLLMDQKVVLKIGGSFIRKIKIYFLILGQRIIGKKF